MFKDDSIVLLKRSKQPGISRKSHEIEDVKLWKRGTLGVVSRKKVFSKVGMLEKSEGFPQ